MTASKKNYNSHDNKPPVDYTTIIQKILRNLHISRTQRKISDSRKRWILQGIIGVISTNYLMKRKFNTQNHHLLHLTGTTQISRRIQKRSGGHISRGIYSIRNQLETQHPRTRNNDRLQWPYRTKKGNG